MKSLYGCGDPVEETENSAPTNQKLVADSAQAGENLIKGPQVSEIRPKESEAEPISKNQVQHRPAEKRLHETVAKSENRWVGASKKFKADPKMFSKDFAGGRGKKDRSPLHPKPAIEPVKRDIPDLQRHYLPKLKFLGPRRSQLTIKQHDIHVATTLNLAKYHRLTPLDFKTHSARLKTLSVENEIFNRLSKQNAKSNLQFFTRRFRIQQRDFNRSRNFFYSKLDSIRHHYPKKYNILNTIDLVDSSSDATTSLEYQKLLLETSKLPKIIMPNLEKRFFVVEPGEVPPMQQQQQLGRRKEMERKDSTHLRHDENIKQLVEKHAPNFVVSFSAAKTFLTNSGPLNSTDWIVPVFVDSCFIQGRKARLVYIMKPLPNHSLDVFQVNYHRYKHALLSCMVHHAAASSGRVGAGKSSAGNAPDAHLALESNFFEEEPIVDLDLVEKFVTDDWLKKNQQQAKEPNQKNIRRSPRKLSEQQVEEDKPEFSRIDEQTKSSSEIDQDSANRNRHSRRNAAATSAEKTRQLLMSPRRQSHSSDQVSVASSSNAEIREEHPEETLPPRKDRLSKYLVTPEQDTTEIAPTRVSLRNQNQNYKHSSAKQKQGTDVLDEILNENTSRVTSTKAAWVGKNLKLAPGQRVKSKDNLLVDPDEQPVENLQDYKSADPDAKICQYALWQLKNFRFILRSNVHGLHKSEYNDRLKNLTKFVRATLLPQLEYASDYGGQTASLEDNLNHFWTPYLKRSFIHLKAHINPGSADLVAMHAFKSDYYLRLNNLDKDLQNEVVKGITRFHDVLTEIYALNNDGFYLLRPNMKNSKLIDIYRPIEKGQESQCLFDLDQFYAMHHWLSKCKQGNDFTFEEIWKPLDPKIVLQWHRILKRVPCSLPPRKDDEKHLLEPEEQTKPKNQSETTSLTKCQKRRNRKKKQQDKNLQKPTDGKSDAQFVNKSSNDEQSSENDEELPLAANLQIDEAAPAEN